MAIFLMVYFAFWRSCIRKGLCQHPAQQVYFSSPTPTSFPPLCPAPPLPYPPPSPTPPLPPPPSLPSFFLSFSF